MRVAVAYDCLYPNTVGGAERWYRNLAERLMARHQVTYLTRKQWQGSDPGTPFQTVAVSPGGPLYTESGRRRVVLPLRFGFGVFWHLLLHGGRYDVVHMASFPYFSVIGAWTALRLRSLGPGRRARPRLQVDWVELWSRDYWIGYLGPIGGRIGYLVQRSCVRMPDRSFTFSRLHERRLIEQGHRGTLTVLRGLSELPARKTAPDEAVAESQVVFAGRHNAEKRVTAIPAAIERARQRLPQLTCTILGDGPEREATASEIRRLELGDAIELRGRVSPEEVASELARATCMLLPSLREGYGLIVVEAASHGTPSIVVEGPDNAATELIEDGVNGVVAASAGPDELAAAIVRVVEGGESLRRSTADWFERNAAELSVESSLAAVERSI